LVATLQVIPHFFGSLVILKTRANTEISTHADDGHHTVISKIPSLYLLLIGSSSCRRSIGEMRSRTTGSGQVRRRTAKESPAAEETVAASGERTMAGSVTMLGKNDQMDGLLGVRVTYTQVGPIGQKAYMGQNIHLHYSNSGNPR